MKETRCQKCGHNTDPLVSKTTDGKISGCYARIHPETKVWMWGCEKPETKSKIHIVMGLLGKSQKNTR